jgi:hypothetical protein
MASREPHLIDVGWLGVVLVELPLEVPEYVPLG